MAGFKHRHERAAKESLFPAQVTVLVSDASMNTGQSEVAMKWTHAGHCALRHLWAPKANEAHNQLVVAQDWQCKGFRTCRATSISMQYFWTRSVMDGSIAS